MAHGSRALSRGVLLLAASLSLAFAQSPAAQASVTTALLSAEAALVAAVQTPQDRAATPDDPPWQAAITAANHALSLRSPTRHAVPS